MNCPGFIEYLFKVIVVTGGGYLFYLMRYNHNAQIEILRATQVDKFIDKINKFKEYYEMVISERDKEITQLKHEIEDIPNIHLSQAEWIELQKQAIDKFEINISNYEQSTWKRFLVKNIEEVDRYSDVIISKDSLKDSIMWDLKFKSDQVSNGFKLPIKVKDEDKGK